MSESAATGRPPGPARQEPTEIDTTRPSVARGYDYALGGKNNYEIDRLAADALIEAFPGSAHLPRDNRQFLRRGVRYLVGEAGVRQILDLGSGLPSAGNVHEVAHELDPEVRVVYVDVDPIVLAHGRALLADEATTTFIAADVTNPESILDDPTTQQFIDFDKPVAILMLGLLHHLSDAQDPVGVTRILKDRMPSGSYLLVSNFLDDDDNPAAKAAERAFIDGGFGTGRFRGWDEQRAFFDGLEMVEPGLTYANDWRPDSQTTKDSPWRTFYAGGLGRKP